MSAWNNKTALVTGSAGFIGYHTCRRLLQDGWHVIGFDAFTDYYDVGLKHQRTALLDTFPNFESVVGRLETEGLLTELCALHKPEVIVHLAAQAGVRYSLDHPRSYVSANLSGVLEVLEAARAYSPRHLLMASTSSAYGANTAMPYRETMKTDHQMSFYAATKKAGESMAHSYAHLYNIPTTMFRFFTVYGAWGRPDMAYFKFARAIQAGEPIEVYNFGNMLRDFTYIDDLIEGLSRLIDVVPSMGGKPVSSLDSLSPAAPWRVVNLGNGAPENLEDFINAIETAMGKRAERRELPMQPGDVPATWADTELLQQLVGPLPKTPLDKGLRVFVDWYCAHYC